MGVVTAAGRRLEWILSLGMMVARVSSRVGAGSRWPGPSGGLWDGWDVSYLVTARTLGRRTPSLTRSAQGLWSRGRRTWSVRAIVAGRMTGLARSRFGAQRQVWCPFRASICIHAVISTPRATMAHQIRF
jgi:hypothetical protein